MRAILKENNKLVQSYFMINYYNYKDYFPLFDNPIISAVLLFVVAISTYTGKNKLVKLIKNQDKLKSLEKMRNQLILFSLDYNYNMLTILIYYFS
ncbi:MAG: hypothetical protein B6U88_00600 [Candidatus Aenigmarchaeota archaeon ex4484_56]|nr:MAG: hypothetical protein B6U88_00600 [Candidatus Aenigmarchaeota archaeon ex4484_56]